MDEPGFLQSPRLAHRAGAALADVVALGAAWAPVVWGIIELGKGGFFHEVGLMLAQALVGAAMVIRIPLRTVWRIQDLTRRERRESIAITPMRPGAFLARNLWRPILRSFLPFITTLPVTAFCLFSEISDAGDFVAIICIFFLPPVVALAGLGDLVARLCQGRSPGTLSILVPLLWAAAAIGVPILMLWVADETDVPDALSLFLLVAMTVLSIPLAVWRWRRAARVYYRFE